MSDRARGLAEETLAKLILCVDGIEPMDADAADTAHGIIEEALRTAEQRGYDAGLKRAAHEATHGNGQHSVEIASRILALISSSPATNEFDAKRTEAK